MSLNLNNTRLGELLATALGDEVIDDVKDLNVSIVYNCTRHEMCLTVKSKAKNKDKSKVEALKIIYKLDTDVIICPNNINASLINDIHQEIKASRELLVAPIIESYTEKINIITHDVQRCGEGPKVKNKQESHDIPLNVAVRQIVKEHFDM